LFQARLIHSIGSTLGRGYSIPAIVSSLSLAIIILFYSLSVASYFRPDVYKFEDRTTYHQYFEDRYIFSRLVDSAIINLSLLVWISVSFVDRMKWLILLSLTALLLVGLANVNLLINQVISIFSMPFILSVYAINKKKKLSKKILKTDSSPLTLNYFLISFMILALVSIFVSMSDINANDPFIDIMTLLSRYTPVIMVLLIFSVLVRIILKEILSIVPVRVRSVIFSITEPFSLPKASSSKKAKIVLLSCFMALSVFIVLIPHLGGQQHKVAEDTSIYAKWIDPMNDSKDIPELLRLAFVEIRIASTGDRPLSLLILHSLSSFFDTVSAFEIVLPALLAPLLVLIVYFLTKELTDNTTAAFFSSFITAVSFQVMIGMYAGFYAAWIALIFGYLSLIFALRYLKNQDNMNLVWLSISMIALLFSHVYTWTLFTAFFIIFLLVLKWKRVYDSRSIGIILIIVIAVFVTDLVRSYLIGLSSGIQRDIVIAESFKFGLSQAGAAWSNIVRTVEVHLGGIFGNIITLSLALYSAIMLRYNNVLSLFVMVFLSIGILPLLFGDKIVQSRVLYDIPFQIPVACALTSVFASRHGKLISIVIAVSLLAISIYTMNNLGVAPR
jgi:hypothetical protein